MRGIYAIFALAAIPPISLVIVGIILAIALAMTILDLCGLSILKVKVPPS